ncbi:MgtC/SapB family protein [Myxococcaceae bacterium GXIMD 01537]
MPAVLDEPTVILRLAVAFALSGMLGLEREVRGQPAGLRTHLLVCLGSCLFTLASLYAGLEFQGMGGINEPLRADVTRIASQVVVGIGFLGGGAILHQGTTVRGLTTAANLWLTASVGLAVGLGLYLGAIATALLALGVLTAMRPVERRIARWRERHGVRADGEHP